MSEVSNMPTDGLRLTPSQAEVWASQRLHPTLPLLNESMAWSISGEVHPGIASAAWSAVVADHPVLTTTVVELDGQAVQRQGIAGCELQIVDLSGCEKPVETAQQWMHEHIKVLFDPAVTLVSSVLIKLDTASWIWLCKQHHVIADAWSMTLVWEHFARQYAQLSSASPGTACDAGELPGPAPSYLEFVEHALQSACDEPEAEIDREYWRARQCPSPLPVYHRRNPALELKKPGSAANTEATRATVALTDAQSASLAHALASPGLRSFSRELALYSLVLTVLSAWLHRVTGESVLYISSPVSGRFDSQSKQTVGQFIEMLPLRLELGDAKTFGAMHKLVQLEVMSLLRHARTNSCLQNSRQRSNVVLNFVTGQLGEFAGMPATVEWLHTGHIDAHHDIRIHVTDWFGTGVPQFEFDFKDDIFNADQRNAAITHFFHLFDAMTDSLETLVDAVPLVSPHEKWLWQADVNRSTRGPLVHESILAGNLARAGHAGLQHDATAVVQGDMDITYAQLWHASTLVQERLAQKGVAGGDRVIVYLTRSWQLLPVLLGVMAVGATYVPVDAGQAIVRLEFILDDVEAACVVTDANLLGNIPDGQDVVAVEGLLGEPQQLAAGSHRPPGDLAAISADAVAYILYTSGSTGNPKGVEISHGAMRNYLQWATGFYAATGPTSFPFFTAIGFDLTVTSLFVPLLSGGAVHVYPETAGSSVALMDVLDDDRVDVIKLTPAHLSLIQEQPPARSRVRQLIVGGEDLKTQLANRILQVFDGQVVIHNEYGPTEATVGCVVHTYDQQSDRNSSVPIGLPVAGMQVMILNAMQVPQPEGVPGELYIAGPSLANGYWQQEKMTQSVFVHNRDTGGGRMYRSGDMVRAASTGVIEYLGRIDEQLSVNGVRIEAAEIETALMAHSAVTAAVATTTTLYDSNTSQLFCKQCGLSSRYPGASMNHDGICSLCINFERYRERVETYFRPLHELETIAERIRQHSSGQYDCMMLLSGGKDSSYALARVQDMGLRVLAYTLDNGFISDEAKANIKRVCEALQVDHRFASTPAMNRIFVDSLERFSNVCNGCFKTIYTLSLQTARELEIPVIFTGLSRGQFFETRLTEELFTDEELGVESIDEIIISARKAYHRQDDVVSQLLDVTHLGDDRIFESIQIIDFYRYCDVHLDEMMEYLETRMPWERPSDTGRSTNCLINDIGISVHKQERGFHNYSFPYSWDVRLGHKNRDQALEELDDEIDETHVETVLSEIGYTPADASMSSAPKLVGYYTSGIDVSEGEIRSFLADRLPGTMMPTYLVRLGALPINSNGKIDKSSLPPPSADQERVSTVYVGPEGDVEIRMCDIWQKFLKQPRIGVNDNFFAIGGDSLLALRVTAELNRGGYSYKPTDIFEFQTIAKLSGLERHGKAGDAEARVEAFASVDKAQLAKLGKLLKRPSAP